MLLASAQEWPAGARWALEPKWDGYRLIARVADGRARCWTRHRTDVTGRVGALAHELVELLPDHSVVDGELVALACGPGGEPGQDTWSRWTRTTIRRPVAGPVAITTSAASGCWALGMTSSWRRYPARAAFPPCLRATGPDSAVCLTR
jgi:hypothetical protein